MRATDLFHLHSFIRGLDLDRAVDTGLTLSIHNSGS
ncbi:hypothetical protein FrEUN1fDRAFT_1079 [Parafrankia sp. EUN1f]|nr:hypothetical protein FrEUN1fDRAFT_1079 [Parafrankia sp. EUN1f]